MPKKRTTAVSDPLVPGGAAAPARPRKHAPAKRNTTSLVENSPSTEATDAAVFAAPNAEAVMSNTDVSNSPTFDEIARRAYSYWEARGYQGGSSEEDWLRAEQELIRS